MSSLIKESLTIGGFVDIAVWWKRGVLNGSQLLRNLSLHHQSPCVFFLRDGVKESMSARRQVIHAGILVPTM
jgi:hypothetical protein